MSLRASPEARLNSTASVMPDPLVTKAPANWRGPLTLDVNCLLLFFLTLLAHQLGLGRLLFHLFHHLFHLLDPRRHQADHQLILGCRDRSLSSERNIAHVDGLIKAV